MFRKIFEQLHRIEQKQDAILHFMREIRNTEESIIMDLTKVQADVAANGTVIGSAVTLITGLKTALDAAIVSNDPEQLTALSASLEAQTAALSAAVASGTSAAPGA